MYQHTQLAWTIWGIVTWIASFLAMAIVLMGNNAAILLFAGVLLLVAVVFYGLTIKVDQKAQQLSWWFGPGVAKKSLNFDEISSIKAVTNTFRHGVGMRITNDGWVYSVSGFRAVEITLSDGMKYRLGTNDQAALIDTMKDKVIIEPKLSEEGTTDEIETQLKKRKKDAFDMN